tara:strand:- start:1849 stop:3018 length:1170 start_codon:yes stop_codon:yes gene_type:complete
MGKSSPPQPQAPDYAEANREAIYADIDTLPTRRKIESAARLGERVEYADPETGETKVADFTGFGDMQLTEQEMNAALDLIPTMSQAQLDNLTEFGPQFVEQQRGQLRQMAPEEFDLREEFAARLRGGERTSEELASSMPSVPEYEEVDAPTLGDTGLQSEMRGDLEESIADRLALGEGLSAGQITAIEQDILGQAAKRGQALSGGTALREILGKFRAGEELGRQRRAEATGWLASGQGTADTQNRLAQQSFANAMGRVQQINQARGATFAGQQQNIGQQIGTRQQDVSNIQSMLGLQTVAAQGGALAGLQQGASPFTMPQIQQRGIGLNAQAGAQGAQFAGDVFGTQAGMWQTQMAQPSGLAQGVGMISDLATAGGAYKKGAAALKWGP